MTLVCRTKRQREACALLCGRDAVDVIAGVRLCQACIGRVHEIEQAATERRAVFMKTLARGEKRPDLCAHGGCEVPLAAWDHPFPCNRYCATHCVTHKATHTCVRNRRRQYRANYRERQRVA